jgi:hypothetical protein
VGPRTVLDAVVKRKIPSLRRETNPRIPIVQPEVQKNKQDIAKLKDRKFISRSSRIVILNRELN